MDDAAQAAPSDGRARARGAQARGRGRRVLSRRRGRRPAGRAPARQEDAGRRRVEVRARGSGRLRLQVLPDASGESLGAFVQATTAAGAVVHTDGWSGYNDLPGLGYDHRPRSQRAAPVGEQLLPRAHRAVSNLKAWLHCTHRYASAGHLPAYLDEFVFRHTRRATPHAAFQTLLGLGARHEPATYRQIIDQAA